MKPLNGRRRPLVCMFDSGIGGINLLIGCSRAAPWADYCYFADNYNVPYGNLTEGEIASRVFSVFENIAALRPDAAVVACNTVTASCVGALRKKFSFPVVGVEPAVKQAWEREGRYLVLATEATCSSESFARLIRLYGKGAVICPCPSLAVQIENNIFSICKNGPEDMPAPLEKQIVSSLPKGKFSSVVLGCTHYVFIKKFIENLYSCPVFDGISGTADHLRTLLGKNDHKLPGKGKIRFFCGDFSKNKAVFEKFRHFY